MRAHYNLEKDTGRLHAVHALRALKRDTRRAAPHYRKALAFYNKIGERITKNGHAMDMFVCSGDQTGLLEMKDIVNRSGCVLCLRSSVLLCSSACARAAASLCSPIPSRPPSSESPSSASLRATRTVTCECPSAQRLKYRYTAAEFDIQPRASRAVTHHFVLLRSVQRSSRCVARLVP